MTARLEHANYTVSDTAATASWMAKIFNWHIRWEGGSIHNGHSVHIGTKETYLALYTPPTALNPKPDNYTYLAGLNHIAVVVDDLGAIEQAVRDYGFEPHSHQDYEPGRRFYFLDHDGIEFEVVQYD